MLICAVGTVLLILVVRYDESLWKDALDLSGKTLQKHCVSQLLDRGVSVVRLARAEVSPASDTHRPTEQM